MWLLSLGEIDGLLPGALFCYQLLPVLLPVSAAGITGVSGTALLKASTCLSNRVCMIDLVCLMLPYIKHLFIQQSLYD